jgi:choline dehydrogenase-like flavoprotein
LTLLRIPAEEIEVSEEVDLLVVGGGAAGTAAAIAGARQGLRTTLVEEMPFLGGMSTGGCVGTFCGFYTAERDGKLAPLVGGLPLEIAGKLLERGHALGPIPYKDTGVLPYVPWGVKTLLEELARAEPGLRVLLHAKLTHALVEQGEILGVAVQTRGGRTALRARVYVDASGDAELSRLAGAETRQGDEIQYPSMMFTMQNVDVGTAIANLGELPRILEAHFESEGLPRKSGNLIPTGRPGELLVALSRLELAGRPVNATDADELTWAEMEGRSQAARLSEFLRREVAGFAEAFLADSAARLGVRETRRIVGEYVLTEDDVLGAREFEDGIGRSAWPIERHVRGGETRWRFLERGSFYTIPYRSLVPRGVGNLLVAGRCLSADAGAFGSVRVIGPCMLEGQAVAVAARLIRDADSGPGAVDVDRLRAELAALGVPL